jgi:hypothetical protein
MRAKNPRDEYTPGTQIWIVLGLVGLVTEIYGLWYDWKHPGNRRKWTLTSNARTLGGFDSITGEPIAVPYGRLRRSAVVMLLSWLIYHWTSHSGKY